MYCGWIWKDTSVCSKEKSPRPRFWSPVHSFLAPTDILWKQLPHPLVCHSKTPLLTMQSTVIKSKCVWAFLQEWKKGPKNNHFWASTLPSLRLTIKFSHVMCLPSTKVRTPVSSTWPVILHTAWIQQYFWITFSALGILSYILDYILIQFTSRISFPTILFLTLFRPASGPRH